jgi:hypothetical protein
VEADPRWSHRTQGQRDASDADAIARAPRGTTRAGDRSRDRELYPASVFLGQSEDFANGHHSDAVARTKFCPFHSRAHPILRHHNDSWSPRSITKLPPRLVSSAETKHFSRFPHWSPTSAGLRCECNNDASAPTCRGAKRKGRKKGPERLKRRRQGGNCVTTFRAKRPHNSIPQCRNLRSVNGRSAVTRRSGECSDESTCFITSLSERQGGCQEGQSADGKGEAGINAGTKASLPFAFRKQFF